MHPSTLTDIACAVRAAYKRHGHSPDTVRHIDGSVTIDVAGFYQIQVSINTDASVTVCHGVADLDGPTAPLYKEIVQAVHYNGGTLTWD